LKLGTYYLNKQLEEGLLVFNLAKLHALPSTAERHEYLALQLYGVLDSMLRFCQAVKLALHMEYGCPGRPAARILIPTGYSAAAKQELLATTSSNAVSTAAGVAAGAAGAAVGSSSDVLLSLMTREADEAAAELSLWLQAGKEQPPCSQIVPS
jgi:hypothetical protein